MSARLNEASVDFVESGVSMLVAWSDDEKKPACARGLGAAVGSDRCTLTIFVSAALPGRMPPDFGAGRLAAVTFANAVTHQALQLKGQVLAVRPTTEADWLVQQRYLAAFGEQLAAAGLPRSLVRKVRLHPGLAVELAIDSVFAQSPGPGAGRRLESDS